MRCTLFFSFASSILPTFAALIGAVALSACSWFAPYRIDVRQGNYVDEAMLAQLKPGMTRDNVRFVLGSPLVADVFRNDRWDYVYRFKPGRGEAKQRTISVFFNGDKFDRVEGDLTPPEGGQAAEPRSRVIEVPKVEDD
ncbi:MAG: outer membrane protein assembly factor BamE [Azoarcus sp.]|jgi:outer membrane protein assembly factor BamE|nr:outer membrane protein assembly factor BamE [Azoarcus sp.]